MIIPAIPVINPGVNELVSILIYGRQIVYKICKDYDIIMNIKEL